MPGLLAWPDLTDSCPFGLKDDPGLATNPNHELVTSAGPASCEVGYEQKMATQEEQLSQDAESSASRTGKCL